MKKNICALFAISLLVISFKAFAQKDSSGIYVTADDFKNQKLTYAINYKKEKHQIKTLLFLDATQIRINHHGATYTLDKSETYGYKSTTGDVFRFVDNKEYKILNPGEEIPLYLQTTLTSPLVNPAKREEDYYYFSTSADGPLIALIIDNLKKAYRSNSQFLALINKYFKTDEELISYDSKHKIYTLNRLFQFGRR